MTELFKLVQSDLSAVIALVAMFVTVFFSIKAMAATRKQIRLQRFQARQTLRNHARAWADEVVANLQDGITHCFLYKQNPDSVAASDYFTRLAGKLSELIDRGRWHFENDKVSGFGMWKEGAFQGLAPKAIDVLKEFHRQLVGAAKDPPNERCGYDRLRQELTAQKREFVSEVQEFIKPSQSMEEVDS